MINLLPYDTKRQIIAGRTNVLLVRYLILIGISIVFLAAVSAAVYFVLMNSRDSALGAVKTNEAKESVYSSVQAEATTFRTNLASASTILSQSVPYSNVMISIAEALPPGVVIDSLTLSAATLGVPITLNAHAKSNTAALQLKTNFTNSPIFSNVSIQSLTSAPATATSGYPIGITLNVTINKVAAS